MSFNSARKLLSLHTVSAAAIAVALPSMTWAQDVELTMWSWLPDLQTQIDMFEAENPGIAVNLENVGRSRETYPKFRNALRAGTGAPDVIHMGYEMQPSFQLADAFTDIGPLGAAELADQYVDWAWAQVSNGDAVYGMPWDAGPIGILYRHDIYEELGLEPAATWDEFRALAEEFKAARPDDYIVSATFDNGDWANALFWQGGSRPFEVIDGETVRININDDAAKRVAEYWQSLLADKLVDPQPAWTNEWYSALDQGDIGGWLTAAWGPVFLAGFATESMGNWRAMPIPQWDPENPQSANWGGSTIAVTSQTEHPEEAAKLAIFLSNNTDAAFSFANQQFLFPVLRPVLESDDFAAATTEFFGGVPQNQVFIESAQQVDGTFQWSPFQDFVRSETGAILGKAVGDGTSLVDALDEVQAVVVEYARDQGFTVIEGDG